MQGASRSALVIDATVLDGSLGCCTILYVDCRSLDVFGMEGGGRFFSSTPASYYEETLATNDKSSINREGGIP